MENQLLLFQIFVVLLVLFSVINILFIVMSNMYIDRLRLDERFPKISKYYKYRRQFSKYYISLYTIISLWALLFSLFINSLLLLKNIF